jgi:hypothetical protein
VCFAVLESARRTVRGPLGRPAALCRGGVLAHPAYRQAGWHQEAPWWGTYIRRRVGMRQHTLAELLNAFLTTGLVIEHVAVQRRHKLGIP